MDTEAFRDLRDELVRLRPPAAADVPAVTRICQDAEIQRWTTVPTPYTEEDARSFALMVTGAFAEGKGATMLVTPADGPEGEVLGCVGLSRDARDRTAELGYWVAASARGQGVAVRASRLLVRAAFDHLDVDAIVLRAAVPNVASNRVAEALGFRRIGTQRSGMIDPRPDAPHPRMDVHLYDLLPGELT